MVHDVLPEVAPAAAGRAEEAQLVGEEWIEVALVLAELLIDGRDASGLAKEDVMERVVAEAVAQRGDVYSGV